MINFKHSIIVTAFMVIGAAASVAGDAAAPSQGKGLRFTDPSGTPESKNLPRSNAFRVAKKTFSQDDMKKNLNNLQKQFQDWQILVIEHYKIRDSFATLLHNLVNSYDAHSTFNGYIVPMMALNQYEPILNSPPVW